MDAILNFVRNSREFQQWGWNLLTVGALGTIVLSALQGWSTLLQAFRVWRDKRADSISVELFSFFFWNLGAYFFYGMHEKSLAIMFNGAIAICYLPVVLGLWRFREGFSKIEWGVSLLCPLMVPGMIIARNKDVALGVFIAVGALFVLDQFRRVWREGPGELEPKVLYVFILSNTFWLIYGCAIGNTILIVSNPLGLAALLGTLWVWKSKWNKRVI